MIPHRSTFHTNRGLSNFLNGKKQKGRSLYGNVNYQDQLEEVATRVAKTIRNHYPHGGGGKKLHIGSDRNHTRIIDKVAEDTIFQALDEMDIDWNIISEEAGSISKGNDLTLIVDPIDGTHNAISNFPIFSTSIGLFDERTKSMVSGVVVNIPTMEIYTSTYGKGSFRDGAEISTRKMAIKEAVVSSYIGPEAKGWGESLIFWPKRNRYFGCISVEICMVAAGTLDMFIMTGRVPRLTDVAAASLILKEAGGQIFLMDMDHRIVPFEPEFDRDGTKAFFAVGDPTSLKRVLEISNIDHTMEGPFK